MDDHDSKMDDVERLVSDLEGIMTDSHATHQNTDLNPLGINIKTENFGPDGSDPLSSFAEFGANNDTELKDINLGELADITPNLNESNLSSGSVNTPMPATPGQPPMTPSTHSMNPPSVAPSHASGGTTDTGGGPSNPPQQSASSPTSSMTQHQQQMHHQQQQAAFVQQSEEQQQSPYIGLWGKVRSVLEENIQLFQSIYGPQFPIQFVQIRSHFADIIEQQKWHLINPDDPGPHDEIKAVEMVRNVLAAIQHRCENTEEVDQKLLFYNLGTYFQNVYGTNPLELVRLTKKVLSMEQMLVQQAIAAQAQGGSQPAQAIHAGARLKEINKALETVTKIVTEVDKLVQELCRLHEYLMIARSHLDVFQKMAESNQMSKEQRKQWQVEVQKHQEYENQVVQMRGQIAAKYEAVLNELGEVHNQVTITEMRALERSQAATYNGAPVHSTLEQLEQWVQKLAEILWRVLRQILNVEQQPENSQIRDNQQNMTRLTNAKQAFVTYLASLVERTLVMEKQPPQVLMKDKRFVATLRHLVGDKLDIHKVAFQVRAHLVSDENARRILAGGDFISSGKIINHTVMTEFHEHSRILQANFRNMTLRDKGRGDRRGTESVAEEKFSIVFQSDIVVRVSANHEFTVTAQTLSLPIVVISHGKQEANAAATIFWDNAFSEEGRVPYHVPERVLWCRFIEALDYKWQSEIRTKIGLTPPAKQYLASKLFGRHVADHQEMCWRQLNRDNLPGHTFTFWQWFYAVMELCKSRYVQPHWNQGAIVGFIGKSECQRQLLDSETGTFMLRFSDSKLGGISTAYCGMIQGKKEVCHLEPDTIKLLQVRSLADTIKDFDHLTYLYPNKNKHEVFSKYYSQKAVPDGPYVKKTLVAHIDN